MKNIASGLGFKLTASSYLVVAVFISIAGFTVFRISQDSIKMGAMEMVREMADDLQIDFVMERNLEEMSDTILRFKIKKTGSAWIMDKDGFLIYNPDPVFREEYITKKKNFGNIKVSLQYASPRPSGTGVFKLKLIEAAEKYEEGFGTYQQFGEKRILAFRSLPGQGLLIGVDQPLASASSELERVKNYIFYTALVSALLIMVFNFFSIRTIIRPYYHEMEDLNESLQNSNKQLEDINAKLAASNRNMTTLYEIGLAMQQSLRLKDILNVIISGAHEVLGIERINLMLPNGDGSFLECRAAIGNEDEPLKNIRVPLNAQGGALSNAYLRKEIVRFDEGMKVPPSLRLAEPYGSIPFLRSRGFVVVPLVVKDSAVGVVGLANNEGGKAITEEQINLMSIFANQAAVAVDNARLYDELRRKIEELDAKVDQLSILHQIGNSMQRVTDLSEALGFIMRGIHEGMGFEEVVFCLLNREEDILTGELGMGMPEGAVKSLKVPLFEEENILVMSAAGKRPVGIVHFSDKDLMEILGAGLVEGEYRESLNNLITDARRAVIVVPLIAREEVVGVVVAGRKKPEPIIRRGEVELLMLYANTAGLTVERSDLYSRMHHDLESMEITDHISRLFTYRYGMQRVQEEMEKSVSGGKPLSVILVGVDSFKEYNDRCGQENGDRSLAEIGEIIRSSLRPSDFAYRYGGRLLAAVLPGAALDDAAAVADGIQKKMKAHRFPGPEGNPDTVLTLSLGVMEKKGESSEASTMEFFKTLLALLHRTEAEGGDRTLTA